MSEEFGKDHIGNDKNANQQDDLDKVLEKINEIVKKSATGDYIYRGETSHHQKVSSGLYREYSEIDAEHFDIEAVQKDILRKARDYIPHEMKDFELTATLQHYGDKTNLIDFTTDCLVALFFACDGKPEEPGRVILLQRESEDYEVEKPPGTIRRAEAQKSIFVQAPKGVVEPDKDNVVSVPADLKRSLLDHLDWHHDISTKTIYNDLQGFIENRELHGNAYTEFYYGLTSQNRAESAKTQGEKKRLNEASIKHYTEAIRLTPNLIEAYNNRGYVYAEIGDVARAIQDFNTAIKINPENAIAYYNRGDIYRRKGDFDRAIQDYNTAIELNPKDAIAYHNRGDIYAEIGDFDRAIQDFNTAIELNPNLTTAYDNRGNTYRRKGDFDQAIEDYNTAILQKPEYAKAYYNRGAAWLHLKEWEKAKTDLITAKNKGIDIVEAYKTGVKAFEEKTDFELPSDLAEMLGGNTGE